MVEATEYWNRLDAALHLRRSRDRLLLGQSLVERRISKASRRREGREGRERRERREKR
jgi:hypothetical protein